MENTSVLQRAGHVQEKPLVVETHIRQVGGKVGEVVAGADFQVLTQVSRYGHQCPAARLADVGHVE